MLPVAKVDKEKLVYTCFNEQEDVMYIVLRDKYFKLPVQKEESWEEMIEYGLLIR